MDDIRRLQIQAENQRIEIVELRNEQRLSGFARIYAAAAVAGLVLMWFPVYEPIKTDTEYGEQTITFAPLIATIGKGGLFGLIIIVALGGLIGLLLTGAFHVRLRTPALPIATAVVSGLGFLLLLTKFGAPPGTEYSGSGAALITALGLLTITGITHTVKVLNQTAAIDAG